jgi:hypothetical protein
MPKQLGSLLSVSGLRSLFSIMKVRNGGSIGIRAVTVHFSCQMSSKKSVNVHPLSVGVCDVPCLRPPCPTWACLGPSWEPWFEIVRLCKWYNSRIVQLKKISGKMVRGERCRCWDAVLRGSVVLSDEGPTCHRRKFFPRCISPSLRLSFQKLSIAFKDTHRNCL